MNIFEILLQMQWTSQDIMHIRVRTPRRGTAPRAGPEAAPQRPKRWTNLVCLIFASG